MRTTKLTETVLAAATWMAFEKEVKGTTTEIMIFIQGKPYIVYPASPGDVERLTHSTAAANAG